MSSNNSNPGSEEGVEQLLGDDIDYSGKFISSKDFSTFELAFDYANSIALDIGFNLIKFRYTNKQDCGYQYCTCTCERFGKYISIATQRKRATTKKCGCPFEIVIQKKPEGNWVICPRKGVHNHPLFEYGEGRKRSSRLSDEGKVLNKKQKQHLVSPANMKFGMSDEFSEKGAKMDDDQLMKGDKLVLRGLKFHGFHGVLPEERKLGQKFLVDMDVWLDLREAGRSDRLTDTISYAEIYSMVKQVVEGEPQNLLESVTHQIASSTFAAFPQISAVRVKLGKPHVAVEGPVDYLGVEIFRTRRDFPGTIIE